MESTKRILFWILQIIGWNAPALNSWAKFLTDTPLKPSYIIIEGLVVFATGIFASSWLRLKLKGNVDFEKFSRQTFKKIALAYFIASILYFLLTLLFASLAYILIQQKPLDVSVMMLISNGLNSFIFMLIWLVFYISIKTIIRLRAVKIKQLELQSEIKEAQLNTLKGQINPHFMFNSLNNIRGLILEDQHKARDMLTRLSEMLRYSLNKENADTIDLSEELEMVENYIALSKIQLEKRLTIKQTIDKTLMSCQIPPMLIQMLVENAIKHGIANQAQGGTVSLNICKKDNKLIIQVINTGKLVQASQSTQLGIINIQKRLKLLYNSQANFTLQEQNQHVIATIKMPYEA
jgi:sensor histidine kinase YesM